MTVAIITLASHARAEHLRRQEDWIRVVAPDAIRVLVQLDPEPSLELGDTSVHVAPGPDGLRLAAGRNRGAREARSRGADLLVFLDVDCLPHPQLLERYAQAASHDRALLCGPVTYLAEGDLPTGPADADRFVAPHPARPAPPAGVIRRAPPAEWDLFWSLSFACTAVTWDDIGGFDEAYEGYGGEDTDFAQAAAAAGVSLIWVGGAHALHQHHPTTSPPWQHLDDILRNGRIFARRWGRWPMSGWIAAFAEAGAIERVDGDWRRVTGRAHPGPSQNLFIRAAHAGQMATEFDRESVIAQVTERLAEKYGDADRGRIAAIVSEEVDVLADKPVHDYVAVLGERAAKKRIKDELGARSS